VSTHQKKKKLIRSILHTKKIKKNNHNMFADNTPIGMVMAAYTLKTNQLMKDESFGGG
jgi:hypothetical protein